MVCCKSPFLVGLVFFLLLLCHTRAELDWSVEDGCKTTEQCQEISSTLVCSSEGECVHKPLWPLGVNDYVGIASIAVGSAISAGGGLGGGSLFVPILMLVFQFDPHMCVYISQVMVCGGISANLILVSRERHPRANRPLINFDAALVLENMTLAGTTIGVFLNVVTPSWLVLLLLVLLLGFTSYQAAVRGYEMYLKEWKAEEERVRLLASPIPQKKALNADYQRSTVQARINSGVTAALLGSPSTSLGGGGGGGGGGRVPTPVTPINTNTGEAVEAEDPGDMEGALTLSVRSEDGEWLATASTGSASERERERQLKEILDYEARVPWGKITVIGLCWLLVFGFSLVKGGEGVPSIAGVGVCTWAYWIASFGSVPLVVAITLYVGFQLVDCHRVKERVGYPFCEGDIHWTHENTVFVPWVSFLSGIVAGMMGIGGGIIKGPLLLYLGLDPLQMAATSAFMIFFTSSCSALQFGLLGLIPLDYGLSLAVVAFVTSYIGKGVVLHYAKKYRKTYLILICVSLAIGLSTLLLGIVGALKVIQQVDKHESLGFLPFCKTEMARGG